MTPFMFGTPRFNTMTLEFPPPTQAEIEWAILRAAQELAYRAAAEARTKTNALDRRATRQMNRLRNKANGGFYFIAPDPLPFDVHHAYDSTRPARRREQLGRS